MEMAALARETWEKRFNLHGWERDLGFLPENRREGRTGECRTVPLAAQLFGNAGDFRVVVNFVHIPN